LGRRSTKSVRFVSLASTCFLPSRRLTLFLMDNSVATFPNPLKHRNALFDEGDWVKSVLWDGENPARAEYFTRLNLNLNDTQMLLEVQRAQGAFSFWLSSHQRSRRESGRVLTSGLPWRPLETADAAPKRTAPKNILGSAEMLAPRDANLDPFNLSNDKEYEGPEGAEAADHSTDVWGPRSRACVSGTEAPVALRKFFSPLRSVSEVRRH
jgi:hypothetical protein